MSVEDDLLGPVSYTHLAGDGYLVRRTDALPVRFALNMERLDEIRARFELMEQINPALVENYAAELGR